MALNKFGMFAGGAVLAAMIGASSLSAFAQSGKTTVAEPGIPAGVEAPQPDPEFGGMPQDPGQGGPGRGQGMGGGMAGGGMMMGGGMAGGGGAVMQVEGQYIYILRGNQILKLNTSDLKVVAQGEIPGMQRQGGGPAGGGRGGPRGGGN